MGAVLRRVLIGLGAAGVSFVVGCAHSDSTDGNTETSPNNEIVVSKCHSKTGPKDCSSQANRAKAISREVFALKDLLTSGMHDFARGKKTQSAEPLELVKMWLMHTNENDKEQVKGFKLSSSLTSFPLDEQVAGIFSDPDKIIDEAAQAAGDDFNDPAFGKKVRERLVNLKGLGVVFGTDGFQQSGCAAPTTFLLVIDTVGKTVDGLDMTPCEE